MSSNPVLSLLIGLVLGAGIGGLFISLLLRSKFQAKLQIKTAELDQLILLNNKAESAQKEMEKQFELLSHRLFDEKSKQWTQSQVSTLSTIIDPFKERLKDFEQKIQEVQGIERSERGHLRGEISKLIDLNLKMSTEASQLTRALKGDVKTQGNWGEMVLDSILEKSGLRKGEEYTVQATEMGLRNNEGEIIRPDVIVHLPEGKHIIIDSKVTLLAYESYSQTQDTEEQEKWADRHMQSIKKHIEGLSQKKYSTSDGLLAPEFVLLFMPIEPAFALAFRKDPSLLQYAWERNIALVSPTTLLTTLRTVAALWRQEKQQKNALEIARRGGALYDKFVSFVSDMESLGVKLEGLQKSHSALMGKLSQGPGNLVRQTEMLRELGAKTEKKLSSQLLAQESQEPPVAEQI